MSQPLKRRSIWLSLFTGLSASLCLALLEGSGIPVLIYQADATGFLEVAMGLILMSSFLASAISGTMRRVSAERDAPEFWVYEVTDSSPLGTRASGKILNGTLRVGDVLHRAVAADTTHVVALRVDEIALYGTLVDEIDAGVSANVVVSGYGVALLRDDTRLATNRYDNVLVGRQAGVMPRVP